MNYEKIKPHYGRKMTLTLSGNGDITFAPFNMCDCGCKNAQHKCPYSHLKGTDAMRGKKCDFMEIDGYCRNPYAAITALDHAIAFLMRSRQIKKDDMFNYD